MPLLQLMFFRFLRSVANRQSEVDENVTPLMQVSPGVKHLGQSVEDEIVFVIVQILCRVLELLMWFAVYE